MIEQGGSSIDPLDRGADRMSQGLFGNLARI
jgi:hypothetical protein